MSAPDKTIEVISSELSAAESTAQTVVARSLDAAERLNETLNAFLQIDREGALGRAQELDREAGSWGVLRGIPVALKDNICVRGMQGTCGSRILPGQQPPFDAAGARAPER